MPLIPLSGPISMSMLNTAVARSATTANSLLANGETPANPGLFYLGYQINNSLNQTAPHAMSEWYGFDTTTTTTTTTTTSTTTTTTTSTPFVYAATGSTQSEVCNATQNVVIYYTGTGLNICYWEDANATVAVSADYIAIGSTVWQLIGGCRDYAGDSCDAYTTTTTSTTTTTTTVCAGTYYEYLLSTETESEGTACTLSATTTVYSSESDISLVGELYTTCQLTTLVTGNGGWFKLKSGATEYRVSINGLGVVSGNTDCNATTTTTTTTSTTTTTTTSPPFVYAATGSDQTEACNGTQNNVLYYTGGGESICYWEDSGHTIAVSADYIAVGSTVYQLILGCRDNAGSSCASFTTTTSTTTTSTTQPPQNTYFFDVASGTSGPTGTACSQAVLNNWTDTLYTGVAPGTSLVDGVTYYQSDGVTVFNGGGNTYSDGVKYGTIAANGVFDYVGDCSA